MGRAGLINSGGASGKNDFAEAVTTAVINKRAGGMGLITGRKAFQRPMAEASSCSTRSRTSTSQGSHGRLSHRAARRARASYLLSIEQNHLDRARNALTRTAARVGRTALGFRFTLLALCLGFVVIWPHVPHLFELFLPAELKNRHIRSNFGQVPVFYVKAQIAMLATALATAPLFAAEGWLFLCDALGARSPRRLALPFALATATVAVATVLVVRTVPFWQLLVCGPAA